MELPMSERRFYVKRTPKGFRDLHHGFDAGQQIDAYVSSSAFLNPYRALHFREGKAGYPVADRLVLRNELVIDFDEKDWAMLWRTMLELNSINFFHLNVIETYRGFHLWVFDFWAWCKIRMPEVRRNEWIIKRQKLVLAYLERNGCLFDFDASYGIKRVFRVPNSRHSKGVVCREVSVPEVRMRALNHE